MNLSDSNFSMKLALGHPLRASALRDGKDVVCVPLDENSEPRQVSDKTIRAFFKKRPIPGDVQAARQIAFVECAGKGSTVAPQPGQWSFSAAREVRRACAVPGSFNVPWSREFITPTGEPLLRSDTATPSPAAVQCSSTSPNPYASGIADAWRNIKVQPPDKIRNWTQLSYDMMKSIGAAAGGAAAVLTGNKPGAFALAVYTKEAADKSYEGTIATITKAWIEMAENAAENAVSEAIKAENAAKEAIGALGGASPNEEAQKAADAATQLAAEAAAAAKRAREAADRAKSAKTLGELADANADAEANYREAQRKRQEAEGKAVDAAAAAKGHKTGGQTPRPLPDAERVQACEELRNQLWECEQSGWRTGPCEELRNRINGCPDVSVILPGDEGFKCGIPDVNPAEVAAAVLKVCQQLVRPIGPNDDPCATTFPEAVRTEPAFTRGCDPRLAHDGCPQPPRAVIKVKVVCVPPPPYAPPLPCVTKGNPPTPGPKQIITELTRNMDAWLPVRDGIEPSGAERGLESISGSEYGSTAITIFLPNGPTRR
jgi:hypothetical protein